MRLNSARCYYRHVLLFAIFAQGLGNAYGDFARIETNTTFTLNVNQGQAHDDCSGGITPGGTDLEPLGYLGIADAAINVKLLAALATDRPKQTISTTPEGATTLYFDYTIADSNLSGTMNIDLYQAVDIERGSTCSHGADIVAYYSYGAGESNLDWVQVIKKNNAFGVDGNDPRSARYYSPTGQPSLPNYLPGDHYQNYTFKTDTVNGSRIDKTWTDWPRFPHPEATAWAGGAEFYMFLASFREPYVDLSTPGEVSLRQDVYVYDVITWGFNGYCNVPEPATMLLLGFGLTVLRLRRLRRV